MLQSTSTLLSILGYVLGSAVGGLIEGRSESLYEITKHSLLDRLRLLDPPDKHDLLRAVRKSYINATMLICDTRLKEIISADKQERKGMSDEEGFLKSVQAAFRSELDDLKKADYVPPFTSAVVETDLFLQWQSNTVSVNELRAKLKRELL